MFMATFIVCVNFLKAWLLSELLLVCLFREVEKGELNRWECTETQIKQANTTTTYTFGESWMGFPNICHIYHLLLVCVRNNIGMKLSILAQ